MAKKIGSSRRKTRHKLSKPYRKKGKISLRKYFQKFNVDDKVILKAEPAIQKGMYHSPFYGKQGIVKGKQGRCYKVQIKDGSKQKVLIVHPVHLKRTQND